LKVSCKLAPQKLLSGRQREIDDAAFETGLRALLDGLTLRFQSLEAAASER
jgi:hypothetical protein